MTIELKMPALSPTMEVSTRARSLVAVGDAVKPGDVLAEIEGEAGDASPAPLPFSSVSASATSADPVTPTVPPAPPIAGGGEVAEEQPAQDAAPSGTAAPSGPPARLPRATALADRIARARGIDLGGADGGRVRLMDLMPEPETETAAPAVHPGVPVERPATVAAVPDVPHSRERLSSMRRTIARRLSEFKRNAPHIYLTVDVRIDALLNFRNELNAALAPHGVKLSINYLFIKATAMALQAEPSCNVQFASDALVRFKRADVAVAVSVPDGLNTPVVTSADARSLSAISRTMHDLADRARQGALSPDKYAGGTASISNLGMFGIDRFAAVLNPPQATILAIGASRPRARDVDGSVGLATIVSITGSFDHRAIDGADGARFLDAFRSLVENPLGLAV